VHLSYIRRPRRAVSGGLAALIAGLALVTTVVVTAPQATAGPPPPDCSFTPGTQDGRDTATLSSNFTGYLVYFVDDVYQYEKYGDAGSGWTLPLDAQEAAVREGLSLRVRVYATDPGAPDLTTSYVCETGYNLKPAVTPTAQTITFDLLTNTRLSDASPALNATATSGLPVEFVSTTPAVCDVVDGELVLETVGTCTVEAQQPGGEDGEGQVFAAAPSTSRTFQVYPDPFAQTISFTTPQDMRYDAPPQALVASATSSLGVAFRSLTPAVCTATGGGEIIYALTGSRAPRIGLPDPALVTPVAPGTCTVEATQEGSVAWGWAPTVYLPAAPVTRSFTILGDTVVPPTPQPPVQPARAAQTITATGVHGVPLSTGAVAVAFRSSAAQPVAVASSTPGVCSWGKGTARLSKAGTCTLTASAAGSSAFLAAAPVTVSFPVWGAPRIPQAVKAPRVLDVLGRGEGDLRVAAGPASVCRAVGGQVAATSGGTCRITVSAGTDKVRSASVEVDEADADKPKAADMDLVGSVRFAYRSAALDARAERTLRQLAPKLRGATLVVVYGNTQAYGAGDTPANRRLSARRAANVVAFLQGLGVKAQTTTVALASRNPAGRDEAANRRAEIYWIP